MRFEACTCSEDPYPCPQSPCTCRHLVHGADRAAAHGCALSSRVHRGALWSLVRALETENEVEAHDPRRNRRPV